MKNTLWYELRERNVGASEVAALFDANPYTSRYKLWHIKKGTMVPDDLSGNERVEAGNRYEAAIIEWANDKYGTDFRQPLIYVEHPTVKGMGCTPDAIAASNPKALAQIKCVDPVVFGRDWECDGDTITSAPPHIVLQCHAEMACTGAEENNLIVAVGLSGIRRMVIHKDPDIEAAICSEVDIFWRSIETNDEPSPDYKVDRQAVGSVRFNRLKSEGGSIDEADFTGNNLLSDAIDRYKRASDTAKEADAAKEAASCEILKIMGVLKKAKCGDQQVSVVDNGGVPEKVITPEMVGNVIAGRKPFSFIKITEYKDQTSKKKGN